MTSIRPIGTALQVALDVAVKGGSTRSIVAGVRPPTAGYAVSLANHEHTVSLAGVSKRNGYVLGATANYAQRHAAILAQPGHYLGAWLDGETLYLDVTQVVPERAVALRLGAERNQLAVFDLGAGEEIKVGGDVTAEAA